MKDQISGKENVDNFDFFPDYEEQANYSHNNNIFVRKSSNISFVMFFSQENEAFGVFGKVL